MDELQLLSTRCPICQTENNAAELYPANFDLQALNPAVFSARRLPDRIHYRLVKCHSCGLVRSDPVAPPEVLARLYRESTFDYDREVSNLRKTYGRYLARLQRFGAPKNALLEIGCGNGFFLEEALAQGWAQVHGVEPGESVVAQADPTVRPHIVCDMMRPGLFAPETFDVICLFQVFDHISDPAALLDTCRTALKPGGFLLFLNHNIEGFSARLLKERSPIVDIEHTCLYSIPTLSRLVQKHGYTVREASGAQNYLSLYYLARLFPFPKSIKAWLLERLRASRLGQMTLSLPLGNLYLIAQKLAGNS